MYFFTLAVLYYVGMDIIVMNKPKEVNIQYMTNYNLPFPGTGG